MRIIDHEEYANVWVGMWWALQTATTVGYGDVTPGDVAGGIVAAVVMLQGIAFLAILTAAITSVFVARASEDLRAQHRLEEGGADRCRPARPCRRALRRARAAARADRGGAAVEAGRVRQRRPRALPPQSRTVALRGHGSAPAALPR